MDVVDLVIDVADVVMVPADWSCRSGAPWSWVFGCWSLVFVLLVAGCLDPPYGLEFGWI
jgi:hypothetical protein